MEGRAARAGHVFILSILFILSFPDAGSWRNGMPTLSSFHGATAFLISFSF